MSTEFEKTEENISRNFSQKRKVKMKKPEDKVVKCGQSEISPRMRKSNEETQGKGKSTESDQPENKR